MALALSLLLHAIGVAALARLAPDMGASEPSPVRVTLLAAEAPLAGTAPEAPVAQPAREPHVRARRPDRVKRPARDVPASSRPAASPAGPEASAAAAPAPDPGAGLAATDEAPSAGSPQPAATDVAAAGSAGFAQRKVAGGYQVRPAYPASSRRAGREGTTLLRVRVSAAGRVDEVVVESSAGDEALDRSARDAVRRWRFEAAPGEASQEDVWVLVPIQFRLSDRSS